MSRVQICFQTDPQPKLQPQRVQQAKMHKNRQFCKYATESIPGRSLNHQCLYYRPVPNLTLKKVHYSKKCYYCQQLVCFLNYLVTIVAQLIPKLDLSLAPLVLLSNAATKHPRSPFQNKTKSTWQLRSTSNIV